jgi:hypothetical protein
MTIGPDERFGRHADRFIVSAGADVPARARRGVRDGDGQAVACGLRSWTGLFVTALNLMPVGQLDGGHIAYGLFGRCYARAIGIGSVSAMLGLGFFV